MLELRSLFGKEPQGNVFQSEIQILPARSPFIRERIDVLFEGETLDEIKEQIKHIDLGAGTFKIICSKMSMEDSKQLSYHELRATERELGAVITAEADVHNPDHLFGVILWNGKWYFGAYQKSEAMWLKHMKKPRQYSTALSTRVARSVANIAVPNPEGVTAIDPCCGIGNVLVEALSMGIHIEGRDINPLAASGARENIAHFGLDGDVTFGPIAEVTEHYDAAIIDLPYNLYTHITLEEQKSIIEHTRRIADRAVIVTIDPIDELVKKAGFEIIDRGLAIKNQFSREVLLCI
ncbi:TRM11 family SAM-dependent methyltransferase [Metabacillus sp. RGM 3146]|uniref:TRM11 family SAM-dependent methyltransferase n=1 Tax=Metabacillus sp. RGM 3146 TaxID=3401092 RepID=UPI003B9AB660